MAKGRRITVTPNVEYCLETLKKAVKAMPEGDLKKKSQDALQYLVKISMGEIQPARGSRCPPDVNIYPR